MNHYSTSLNTACAKCMDEAAKAFPHLTNAECFDVLIGATCYPLGCVENVAPQLRELVDVGCCTVEQCCAFADEKMRNHQSQHAPTHP